MAAILSRGIRSRKLRETEDRGQERRFRRILPRPELARALLEVGKEGTQVVEQSLTPPRPPRVVQVQSNGGEDAREHDEKRDGTVEAQADADLDERHCPQRHP